MTRGCFRRRRLADASRGGQAGAVPIAGWGASEAAFVVESTVPGPHSSPELTGVRMPTYDAGQHGLIPEWAGRSSDCRGELYGVAADARRAYPSERDDG